MKRVIRIKSLKIYAGDKFLFFKKEFVKLIGKYKELQIN